MASGTTYLISDRARRLVQSSVGNYRTPVYIWNGQASKINENMGVTSTNSTDNKTLQFDIYTSLTDTTNQAGLRVYDEKSGTYYFPMVVHNVYDSGNKSTYVNFSGSGLYYQFGGAVYMQHDWYAAWGNYNMQFRKSAARGTWNDNRIQWGTWSGTTVLSNSGTESQYSGPDNTQAAQIFCLLPCYRETFIDGVSQNDKTTSQSGPQLYFRQYSSKSNDLTNTGYYEQYYFQAPSQDRTTNGSWKILTSRNYVTVGQGGTGKGSWVSGGILYASSTSTLTNTANVKTDGSSITITATKYPKIMLEASNANGASTYSKAYIEGGYDDKVCLWIDSDSTNNTKSRRALAVYGYANKSDSKYALALRQCDTTGAWQADQYILTSSNWKNWITLSAIGAAASNHTHTLASLGAAAASHTHSYLPLGGGTMTGNITMTSGVNVRRAGVSRSWINGRDTALVRTTSYNGYDAITSMKTTNGAWEMGVYTNNVMYFTYTPDSNYNSGSNSGYTQVYITSAAVLQGAAWNDYAEYRESTYNEPGRVVQENDNGCLTCADKRLIPGASVISDTFGYAEGKTEKADTPIAVSGRVLVYPYRDRYEYHAGMAVCSAPNGTIDIMTREEIMMYPDCIVGIVSEIPEYETWGTGDVDVNGRIWIKVR